jgi:hypothetical protein
MKPSSWLVAGAIVVTASLSYVYQARAGMKDNTPVNINTTSRSFYGSLGAARNSSDGSQSLGCQISSSSSNISVSCYARSSAGTYATCSTSSRPMVDAVVGMPSDAFISVYYDSSGVCTNIYVYKESIDAPKVL